LNRERVGGGGVCDQDSGRGEPIKPRKGWEVVGDIKRKVREKGRAFKMVHGGFECGRTFEEQWVEKVLGDF